VSHRVARAAPRYVARVNAAEFCDDFDAEGLDTEVWIPHYLPQWSSRAQRGELRGR
jgi:hypothetical protein